MWVEAGFGTNRTNVTYDRTGAAIESLSIEDVDLAVIEASRFFHFTGITPALSAGCHDTLAAVVRRARQAGVRISCDVNYRSKLWSPQRAREVICGLIAGIDLLFVGSGDLRTLWGRSGDPEEELRRLQDEFGIANVILTRGPDGASGLFGEALLHHAAFPSEVVSPIGAGDAFAAGVLFSLLNEDAEGCLKRGCAMAALARESRNDYVLGGIEALEAKLAETRSEKRLSR
jgi:2-dehydro-3-deoxygluconokinase